jgi:hypothetical protein
LLHGDLTEEQMSSLYQHPRIKACVNLAHGEGFGLITFASAFYGLPVLATGWSAHTEFLTAPYKDKTTGATKMKRLFADVGYDLKPIQPQAVWNEMIIPESQWAFPIESSYKQKMKDVYEGYPKYKAMATSLKQYVIDNYKEENLEREFVRSCLMENDNDVFDEEVMKF